MARGVPGGINKNASKGKSYEFTRKKGDRKGSPSGLAAVSKLLKPIAHKKTTPKIRSGFLYGPVIYWF